MRNRTVGLIALAALFALAGCASPPGAAAGDNELHDTARAQAADLARGLYRGPTDTIDDYARWADAKTSTDVEVIGFEPYAAAVHGEPFGLLRFRSSVDRGQNAEPYVACFETEFDFWGVATEEFGDWDDDGAVARDIPCPADAARIEPPVDTRPVKVVPEGTEALVVEVLTAAPPEATAAQLVAALTERMPAPTGDREQAFPPDVAVVDGEIGFAMGDAEDCLLVKRTGDGAVTVLQVPRVRLQPGELGCTTSTALAPAENLRSPH